MECNYRKTAPDASFRAARLYLSLPDSILVGVSKAFLVHSDNGESGLGLAASDAAYAYLYNCVTKFAGLH
jgi:hypothetical protein